MNKSLEGYTQWKSKIEAHIIMNGIQNPKKKEIAVAVPEDLSQYNEGVANFIRVLDEYMLPDKS